MPIYPAIFARLLLTFLERIVRGRPPTAPAWRVVIEPHDVPPRWRIDRQVIEVRATSAADARLAGIREAHRRGELPPWRPLIRASWPFAQAERIEPEQDPAVALAGGVDRAQLSFESTMRSAA